MEPAGGEGDHQGGRERGVCVQGGEDGDCIGKTGMTSIAGKTVLSSNKPIELIVTPMSLMGLLWLSGQ